MFVKLYVQMLDSSIAEDRKLRHFFTDLLLCADADGNVMMTKQAIANRIRATLQEVEWGLAELQKPDHESLTQDEHEGRRVIPLEGHGYGWKIVNYTLYRDIKSDQERRAAVAARVQRHREKKREEEDRRATEIGLPPKRRRGRPKKSSAADGTPLPGEATYVRRYEDGEVDKDGVAIQKPRRLKSIAQAKAEGAFSRADPGQAQQAPGV